ncbi:MAG: class I SAM-dependent methyltransferase [Gammaproteobacteria bacterium]|nr:class I SAM-dependent methyltransferase [Gammaproteobacteria bacterium]
MTTTYNTTKAAHGYDKARAIPAGSIRQWMDFLLVSINRDAVDSVIDLGCGTGRFSRSLAESYQCPVLAIDPSEPMLEQGRQSASAGLDITWLAGSTEAIPASDYSTDLVWMSQVFHHIDNTDTAFAEINRVLTPTGYLAIRNGVIDHLDDMPWFQCFPEAEAIERSRLMTQEQIVSLVCSFGFRPCSRVRHYQYSSSNYREHADKISARGLSSLIAISDEAFERGVERLRAWVAERPETEPVYEPADLLLFQKL